MFSVTGTVGSMEVDKAVKTEAVARIWFPDAVAKTVLTRLDVDQEADL